MTLCFVLSLVRIVRSLPRQRIAYGLDLACYANLNSASLPSWWSVCVRALEGGSLQSRRLQTSVVRSLVRSHSHCSFVCAGGEEEPNHEIARIRSLARSSNSLGPSTGTSRRARVQVAVGACLCVLLAVVCRRDAGMMEKLRVSRCSCITCCNLVACFRVR